MTHSTPCCWSAIRRIDSKITETLNLMILPVLKCSQCHQRRAFPFSSCPSQGDVFFPSLTSERNVSWLILWVLAVGVWGVHVSHVCTGRDCPHFRIES